MESVELQGDIIERVHPKGLINECEAALGIPLSGRVRRVGGVLEFASFWRQDGEEFTDEQAFDLLEAALKHKPEKWAFLDE